MSRDIVIDLETTTHNKIGNNKASPHSPDNCIVYDGHMGLNDAKARVYGPEYCTEGTTLKNIGLLIGQNIKFDINHLRHGECGLKEVTNGLRTLKIWDTQLAEYILTQQESTYASLDDMSVKYGLPVKDDRVKDLWDAGVSTEDIPKELIVPYLEQDVLNTRDIAAIQMQEASDRGILPLMNVQMDALLATTEMEYNGLHIDQDDLATLTLEVKEELAICEELLVVALTDAFYEVPKDQLNVNSKRQISALLFGGNIKYKVKECVGKYKNGRDKFKNIQKAQTYGGIFTPDAAWETKAKGVYKVGEEIINQLYCGLPSSQNLIDTIKRYVYLQKQFSTYCVKTNELIFPDGKIHHNLNHCVTRTGRLSSTNPNMQNATGKGDVKIKKVFTSRFGDAGSICEFDYSQLEVICLAHLTQDKQLMQDIMDGVDLHKGTGWEVYGKSHVMSKEERRIVKGVNFGLIYGGGVDTLSQQTGASKALVKKIIGAFYTRYSDVKVWQEAMYVQLDANREASAKRTKLGYPAGRGVLLSPTGRSYHFYEYDNAYKSTWNPKDTKFSPTEVKNNIVQGFATGDIVPMVMGAVYRKLRAREDFDDKVLMVNQVHDSLVFDIHDDHIDEAIPLIKETMEQAPQMLKEIFNIDFKLPLNVGVSVGENWQDQVELELDNL